MSILCVFWLIIWVSYIWEVSWASWIGKSFELGVGIGKKSLFTVRLHHSYQPMIQFGNVVQLTYTIIRPSQLNTVLNSNNMSKCLLHWISWLELEKKPAELRNYIRADLNWIKKTEMFSRCTIYINTIKITFPICFASTKNWWQRALELQYGFSIAYAPWWRSLAWLD